jgi:hypothetical protein
VDEDGKPLASAFVQSWLCFSRLSTSDASQETDENGRFEFTNIITGQEGNVYAKADGYGKTNSERFTLEPGEERDLDDLELRLADQVLEGILLDEDEEPVANAQVYAYGHYTEHTSTRTDKDGKFRLESLVDEEISINAHHKGQSAYMRVAAGETDVEVVLGQQRSSQSAEERRAAILVGKEAPALDVAAWVGESEVPLDSLRGQAVALVFWDSAAEDAAEAVGMLQELAKKRRKLALVGVHKAEAEPNAVEGWMKERGASFPTAVDKAGSRHGATSTLYRARKLPAVYLIDEAGVVQYQDLPLAAVEQAVKNLASGK